MRKDRESKTRQGGWKPLDADTALCSNSHNQFAACSRRVAGLYVV